ncbi:Rab family GTPase [Calothrix sp. NIES-3974]|uniref:Rab family GTPase n=1 Tax=Calothrix sp. NIES-3974 TaxID=2005462 RepID=UPI000B622635|nr:Rab family GTPase [Calothrix sp. NIES-3974]BAZ05741.1 small GTP-binding protein [Calothrix sp. NIES-3974]
MLQKKVCMVGAFATGKTSLIARFVRSIFSENYQTTVGVKIDKKTVFTHGKELNLILWDLYGEDEFQKVHTSYLRGSSGYLLVVDGTRHNTLDVAFALKQRVEDSLGNIPFVMVLNKADLVDEWDIENEEIEQLTKQGWIVIQTSAKTGDGVEEVFQTLADKIMEE